MAEDCAARARDLVGQPRSAIRKLDREGSAAAATEDGAVAAAVPRPARRHRWGALGRRGHAPGQWDCASPGSGPPSATRDVRASVATSEPCRPVAAGRTGHTNRVSRALWLCLGPAQQSIIDARMSTVAGARANLAEITRASRRLRPRFGGAEGPGVAGTSRSDGRPGAQPRGRGQARLCGRRAAASS